MSHKRTAIRTALVAALTGLTTTGSHVYAGRLRPLTDADLPALLISTNGEDFGPGRLSNGLPAQREMRVQIDVIVKSATGYLDTADAILAEIETALFAAHVSLGGLIHSISPASIDDPEMDDSTDKPVVRLPVNLRVVYS